MAGLTYLGSLDSNLLGVTMRRSLGLISKRSRLLGKKSQRLTIPQLVKSFEVGGRVIISPRTRFSGMPHPRYRGRSGIIVAKRGDAYLVKIRDGRMEKGLVIPAIHLHSANTGSDSASPNSRMGSKQEARLRNAAAKPVGLSGGMA